MHGIRKMFQLTLHKTHSNIPLDGSCSLSDFHGSNWRATVQLNCYFKWVLKLLIRHLSGAPCPLQNRQSFVLILIFSNKGLGAMSKYIISFHLSSFGIWESGKGRQTSTCSQNSSATECRGRQDATWWDPFYKGHHDLQILWPGPPRMPGSKPGHLVLWFGDGRVSD